MTATPLPVSLLLVELARRGIELRADGDRLRYRPRSAMTPDLAEGLTATRVAPGPIRDPIGGIYIPSARKGATKAAMTLPVIERLASAIHQ